MDNLQDQKNQSFPSNIKQIIPKHCENCGNKYSDENLKVVRKTEQALLLHLQCASCGHAYMINVVSPNMNFQGSSRIPINTDISSAGEIEKFAGRPSINPDDVLDAVRFAKSLDKNSSLKDLLSKSDQ